MDTRRGLRLSRMYIGPLPSADIVIIYQRAEADTHLLAPKGRKGYRRLKWSRCGLVSTVLPNTVACIAVDGR